MKARLSLAAAAMAYLVLFSQTANTAGAAGGWANDMAVQLSAVVQPAPPRITLNWPNAPRAGVTYNDYTLYRKAPSDASWGTPLASLPGTATAFADTSVSLGVAYEYQVVRSGIDDTKNSAAAFSGYGYVLSGIEVPPVDTPGKMILLVDSSVAASLSAELATLEQDLVGDGWTVLRHDVAPGAEVALAGDPQVLDVKSLIQTDYHADPQNVKGLFLFGHIPVPYSGDTQPDGHADHEGAWPTDMFYADMTGTWADTAVNHANAGRPPNQNIPGDGKFDPSVLPPDGQVVLQTGRVDFYNLPLFEKNAGKDEMALLRQYLAKDHQYRHRLAPFSSLRRRALYGTNMPDPFQRNYAIAFINADPLFGPEALDRAPWIGALTGNSDEAYPWAFGMGTGAFDQVHGLISTAQITTADLHVVFSVLEGSYLGDWNTRNNVIRAMLGSTRFCLGSCYGVPVWHYHRMALGSTLGESALLTQNARLHGLYPNLADTTFSDQFLAGIQAVQMGDPSLRLFPVAPPSTLKATASANSVALAWTASPDAASGGGYHVYRSASAAGPFVRISKSLLKDATYTDADLPPGAYCYQVRALHLETTGSGTYWNPSQGIAASATIPTVGASAK